jgi:hypothetical protein
MGLYVGVWTRDGKDVADLEMDNPDHWLRVSY